MQGVDVDVRVEHMLQHLLGARDRARVKARVRVRARLGLGLGVRVRVSG